MRKKSSRTGREAGHFAKAGVPAGTFVRESRTNDVAGYELGSELAVTMFEAGQKVDVTGVSKGKGFQGVLKRYHFAGQDRTHGNSFVAPCAGFNRPNQTPGRVFPVRKCQVTWVRYNALRKPGSCACRCRTQSVVS